jgi:hypothetical protein
MSDLSGSMANLTRSFAVRTPVGVIQIEDMTLKTMRLISILINTTPPLIFFAGNSLQMQWVNAAPCSA